MPAVHRLRAEDTHPATRPESAWPHVIGLCGGAEREQGRAKKSRMEVHWWGLQGLEIGRALGEPKTSRK